MLSCHTTTESAEPVSFADSVVWQLNINFKIFNAINSNYG